MCQQSTIIYADITDYINGNEKLKICRQIAATAPQMPASGIFSTKLSKLASKMQLSEQQKYGKVKRLYSMPWTYF